MKQSAPAEDDPSKRLRVVARPVDPIQLSEAIAREVCRQHGAAYKGHRFRARDGVFEVAALGVLDGALGQTVIVGEVPVGAKAWQEENESP